jgi:hypothetical protein
MRESRHVGYAAPGARDERSSGNMSPLEHGVHTLVDADSMDFRSGEMERKRSTMQSPASPPRIKSSGHGVRGPGHRFDPDQSLAVRNQAFARNAEPSQKPASHAEISSSGHDMARSRSMSREGGRLSAFAQQQANEGSSSVRQSAPTKHRHEIPDTPTKHRHEMPPHSPPSQSSTPQSGRGNIHDMHGDPRARPGMNLPPPSSVQASGLGAAATATARRRSDPDPMIIGHSARPPLSHAAPNDGGGHLIPVAEIVASRGRGVRRTVIDSPIEGDSSRKLTATDSAKREERLAALKKVAEVKGSEWELDKHVSKVESRRASVRVAESATGRLQGNPLLPQEGFDHAEPKSYQRQSTTQAISVRSQRRSAAPRASTINKMDTLASGTRSHVAMERYDPAVGAHSLVPSHKMREHLLQSQRSGTAEFKKK